MATFPTMVCQVKCELPNDAIAVSLNLIQDPNVNHRNRQAGAIVCAPDIQLGSLVLLFLNGRLTHTGITSGVFNDAKSPDCIFDFWPTKEPVLVQKRPRNDGRLLHEPIKYSFEAAAGDLNFVGSLSKLPSLDADYLRNQIGLVTHKKILEIFWSGDEILQIKANLAAQAGYEQMATALIESLET